MNIRERRKLTPGVVAAIVEQVHDRLHMPGMGNAMKIDIRSWVFPFTVACPPHRSAQAAPWSFWRRELQPKKRAKKGKPSLSPRWRSGEEPGHFHPSAWGFLPSGRELGAAVLLYPAEMAPGGYRMPLITKRRHEVPRHGQVGERSSPYRPVTTAPVMTIGAGYSLIES